MYKSSKSENRVVSVPCPCRKPFCLWSSKLYLGEYEISFCRLSFIIFSQEDLVFFRFGVINECFSKSGIVP